MDRTAGGFTDLPAPLPRLSGIGLAAQPQDRSQATKGEEGHDRTTVKTLLLLSGLAMKSLEIIHLRLAGNPQMSLIEQVRSSIAAEGCPMEVRIYRDASVPTDLAIHLLSGEVETCASDLGLRIAAALREHGMVDHTVWNEEEQRGK
jgi:hypothetical protein